MTTLTPDDSIVNMKEKNPLSRNIQNKRININPMSSTSTKHSLLMQTTNHSKSTNSLLSSPLSTISKSKINLFKTQSKMKKVKLPKLKIRSLSSLDILSPKGRNKKSDFDLISLTSLYNSYININEEEVKAISKRKQKLEKIYKINDEYANKQKSIKIHNEIAFRKDFDIESYQNMLISFTGMKARRDLMIKMRRDLINTRKTVELKGDEYKFKQKNRWDALAEKIEHCVPMYLVNHLGDLSKIKLNEIKKRYMKIDMINRKYSYNRKSNNVLNSNKNDDTHLTIKKEEKKNFPI